MLFAKARRRKAIEERVTRMFLAGVDSADFGDIYFEAARKFAIETGAKHLDRDAASTYIQLGGRLYSVIFTRSSSGGAWIHLQEE